MEKQWSELTKEEKRERRLKDYISGEGIKFRDAKAERLYKERVDRQLKTSMCQVPDRVPVSLPLGIARYPKPRMNWASRPATTAILEYPRPVTAADPPAGAGCMYS